MQNNATRFALRVGLLIDGGGGEPVRDAIVQVAEGRIVAAGRAEEFGTAGDGAQDMRDLVLLPGLVDCHAHATLYPDRQPFEVQLQTPDEMLALTAQRQLTVHLRSGVTTVPYCASRGQSMFWVREAIRRGYFPGPRLQLAGRAITHSAGHICWTGGVADTPEEIRRNVRILVADGADVIHLEYSVHLARLAGLSPMESLQVVTRNAARLCGLQDRVGRIGPGLDADLLLVRGNPLDDEQNLTQVEAVYKSGVRVG